ncbi:MAG: DUF433 domain-containing protein [Blastocatellia bacterium]
MGLLAQGATSVEILEEYDELTAEDLRACFSSRQNRSVKLTLCPL